MTQQVSKKKKLKRITSFSAATGSFSFCPFCTFTGEEELAGTTEEVTVGLKMINGRYRDVNVTLTAVAATLEPVVFFSVLFFLSRVSNGLPHQFARETNAHLQQRSYRRPFALTGVSVRQLAVLAPC